MGPQSECIFCVDYMEDIEQGVVKLVDEICESEGKVPDREIDKMMRELIDINSLYTRLRHKKSKYKPIYDASKHRRKNPKSTCY